MKTAALFVGVALAVAALPAMGADITIRMRSITATGVGNDIGKIRAVDTAKGLRLVPRLSGLAPGAHGFHVHQNPSCGAKGTNGQMGPGLAAGGEVGAANATTLARLGSPAKTGRHEGPGGKGHLGDLPVLMVDKDGLAKTPVTAPRLKVADLWGHAIIIHAGGDNYSDQPAALGGGGARVACATVVRAKRRARR